MKTRIELRVGRNAPCPCGSGKKFKRCCFTAEKFLAHAMAGTRFSGSGPIPADIPMEVLTGVVVYNDGQTAKVEVPDDTVIFERSTETDAEWYAGYGVGTTMQIERFSFAAFREVQ